MDPQSRTRAIAFLEDVLTLGAVVIAVQFYLALLPYSAALGTGMVVVTWAGLAFVRGDLKRWYRPRGTEPIEAESW